MDGCVGVMPGLSIRMSDAFRLALLSLVVGSAPWLSDLYPDDRSAGDSIYDGDDQGGGRT